MLKKMLMAAALFLGSLSTVQTAAAKDSIESEMKDSIILSVNSSKVYVHGKLGRIDENDSEAAPFVENGHTLVPLRFISEQLGAKILWNQETREVTIDVNGHIARMFLGDNKLYLDNRQINLNTPSKTVNGKTYLPLRSVVEDLFHQNLFYKNGIIIISDEAKTISDAMLAELEKILKPRIVYSGGVELFYIYSDGSTFTEDLGYREQLKRNGMIKAVDVGEGSFYIADNNNYLDGNRFVHKTNLEGTRTKTIQIDMDEQIHLILAKDDNQYYYANGNIVQISDHDEDSVRKIIGPGYLSKEHTHIQDDQIWFTDYSGDHAIYKLHKGKKTKLSDDNSFMKHVVDDWIFYTYFENKRWALYRMTKEGGKKTKLSADADVRHSLISDNKIYYFDNQSKALRVMNLDGSGKKVICKLENSGIEIFAVHGGYVYFSEEDQNDRWTQTLNKANVSNETKQKLVEVPLEFSQTWERIKNIQILGDNVYYTINNQIFTVKDDGSSPKALTRLYGRSDGILSLVDR